LELDNANATAVEGGQYVVVVVVVFYDFNDCFLVEQDSFSKVLLVKKLNLKLKMDK
jgi:hypothetical protein